MPGLRGPRGAQGVQGLPGANVDANGNLAATTINGYKPLTEPSQRIGVSATIMQYSIKTFGYSPDEILKMPEKCRELGVTDLEILAPSGTFAFVPAVKPYRPTIAEVTPLKLACEKAGVSIVSMLVDNCSNVVSSTLELCRPWSSNVYFRDQCVEFVRDVAPVYKFLGVKMMRLNLGVNLAEFSPNDVNDPVKKALFFANVLDTFTRATAVAQGIILTVENHSEYSNPAFLIDLYNYVSPTVPTFSLVVDTSNFEYSITADEVSNVIALAPYAYQFSLKFNLTDFGYKRLDGSLVEEVTADRKIAWSSTGYSDLHRLIDIVESVPSVVPVRASTKFLVENERNKPGRKSDILFDAYEETKRVISNLLRHYPRFKTNQLSMLSHGLVSQLDNDLEYLSLNMRTVIEQSQRNEELVTQERMENWHERTQAKIARGKKYHYIVVGGGSAGASAAQALASFTRGQGKKVLLVERGASRPLSYFGGEYSGSGGIIEPGVDKLNEVFGQYYVREASKIPAFSILQRILQVNTNMPTINSNVVGTNIIDGYDPYVMGGGSTYNGGSTHFATGWYNERNCVRGNCGPLDFTSLDACGDFVLNVVGNKEDDYYVTTENQQIARIFNKLETKTCYPWIGNATGEAKDEMRPSKVIRNLGVSSAETGGMRFGLQSLRVRSTGMPRRNGSAALIEQFDNNFFNLDVLTNAKCEKILFEKYETGKVSKMFPILTGNVANNGTYVTNPSNAVVAYGLQVIINDLVDDVDEPAPDGITEIYLKPGGEIFVAGNAYNSPVLLERSGIGQKAVIEAALGPNTCIRENNEVGQNFHNNYYITTIVPGLRMAVPQGTINNINNNATKSNKDIRRMLRSAIVADFSIAHNDDSDRSSIRGTRFLTIPAIDSNVMLFTDQSGFDSEVSGAVTNGSVHINSNVLVTDKSIPVVNYGWFLNDKDGRRNIDGGIRAIKKMYAQLTSNEAAYYLLGSGKDFSNVAISRHPDCERESNVAGISSGYFTSRAGGVYNQGYAGLNLDTATYEEIRTAMLTRTIREAIHWCGTVMYGKATDKNFIVKGTHNVRCCCSAVMSEPYHQNNWGMVTQWARYIAMHALGMTTLVSVPTKIKTLFSNAVTNSIKFDLGVANSNLTIAAFDSVTSNLTYYITKDGVQFPNIVGKFSRAKNKFDGKSALINFRTVNDTYNAYDIPLSVGNYSTADCGIMQSKLQFEFVGGSVELPKYENKVVEWTKAGLLRYNLGSMQAYQEGGPDNMWLAEDATLFFEKDELGNYPDVNGLYPGYGARDPANHTYTFVFNNDIADLHAGQPVSIRDLQKGLNFRLLPGQPPIVSGSGVPQPPFTLENYFLLTGKFWGPIAEPARSMISMMKAVEITTHRWTEAGILWATAVVFPSDGIGGRINPFDNKPAIPLPLSISQGYLTQRYIQGITKQSETYMIAANPTWTLAWMLAQGYATLNPWYAESLLQNPVLLSGESVISSYKVSQLTLAIAAYDSNDRFVDTIAGVPLQPGMTRFTGPVA
jgi:hypothetical protein